MEIDARDSSKSLNITQSFFADEVTFIRDFSEGVMSSLILPFDYHASDFSGTFHIINGINGDKPIRSDPIENLEANKAYYFMPSANISTVTFKNVTLQPTVVQVNGTEEWKLIGFYDIVKSQERSDVVYGIASKNGTTYEKGDIVKMGMNAKI